MRDMITPDSIAGIEFRMTWKSREAQHEETLFSQINFWRDVLPETLRSSLMGAAPGDTARFSAGPGEAAPPHDPKKELQLRRRQFDDTRADLPRAGRFYPKGLLRDVANVFPNNIHPFRCVGVNEDTLTADFNHPFSPYELELSATVHEVFQKPYDRGGELSVLLEKLTEGPGMQARWRQTPTDFLSPTAFEREASGADAEFYTKPRFVVHTDARAIEDISAIYGRLLTPDTDVLDLMSSWRSHIPESLELRSLAGLGMNAEEMSDNPQLTDHLIHDINTSPRLPFEDRSFDGVICTVSVEYMTSPSEVFEDVARILRPGGWFILTFSNRWFPPKVIRLWTELHEFERMGLVSEYFLRTGQFENLGTFSSRGWPRAEDDKYYPEMRMADPLYAVWGQRCSQ